MTEILKDLIDWLDLLSKPEYVKSILDRAKQEREQSELFDLESPETS